MKRQRSKTNKLERVEQKKKAVEYHQSGAGMFIFRNRSTVASLELPKVSADGKKWVNPGQTWKGDSYYLSMVPRDAILVEDISVKIKENEKMPEKLILDQPDQITSSGKVEHAVLQGELPMNEVAPQEADIKNKLITEDPLAGVTIIRD